MQIIKISKLDNMTFDTIFINDRILLTDSKLEFQPAKNYLFPLKHLNLVQMDGNKAREFLQGQLSCDIRAVDSHTMRPGLLCNLKGRIMALMDIVDWQETLFLILPEDMMSETIASLNKTALFSRVTLSEQNELNCYGFYLQNDADKFPFDSHELPHDQYGVISNGQRLIYRISETLYIIITSKEHAHQLEKRFVKHQQLKGSLNWHFLTLQSGLFQIYPCSRGLFLPQRLGLHDSVHISFDKGCYKGQEIIARMHYRSKNKHGMRCFKIKPIEGMASGLKLFTNDSKKEVGEIIDFCPLSKNETLILASMIDIPPTSVLIEGHYEPLHLV